MNRIKLWPTSSEYWRVVSEIVYTETAASVTTPWKVPFIRLKAGREWGGLDVQPGANCRSSSQLPWPMIRIKLWPHKRRILEGGQTRHCYTETVVGITAIFGCEVAFHKAESGS